MIKDKIKSCLINVSGICCKRNILLSGMENKKFIEMFGTVSLSLYVSSRQSVVRHILDLASNVRAKLKNKLFGQSHLCTTADIWSTKHTSYMGVSVH